MDLDGLADVMGKGDVGELPEEGAQVLSRNGVEKLMGVETKRYIRKALYVDAVRVTTVNMGEVAQWCDGEILLDGVSTTSTGKRYIAVRVTYPKNARQTKAFVGDWILYAEQGYKIYTNRAFRAAFDEAPEEIPATEEQTSSEYPYPEGDTIVIGPQCFASKDGQVLNWRGVNFVPQGTVEDDVHDALEELDRERTA